MTSVVIKARGISKAYREGPLAVEVLRGADLQVQQGEIDEAMLRAANSTAGVLFHYPATQVDKTVRGVAAFAEGDAGPQAILFGPPKP